MEKNPYMLVRPGAEFEFHDLNFNGKIRQPEVKENGKLVDPGDDDWIDPPAIVHFGTHWKFENYLDYIRQQSFRK